MSDPQIGNRRYKLVSFLFSRYIDIPSESLNLLGAVGIRTVRFQRKAGHENSLGVAPHKEGQGMMIDVFISCWYVTRDREDLHADNCSSDYRCVTKRNKACRNAGEGLRRWRSWRHIHRVRGC